MGAEAGARPLRRGRTSRLHRDGLRLVRRAWKPVLWTAAALGAALLAAGVVFAGSPERIPAGVSVAGVSLNGLTAAEAEAELTARAAAVAAVPVAFTAPARRWELAPADVGLRVGWATSAAEALAAGDGPLPLRGLVRLKLRLFGLDVAPQATAYEPALDERLARVRRAVNVRARPASLVLRGLEPLVVPGEAGRLLDAARAERVIVGALARFERERPVPLPVAVEPPSVTAAELAPAAGQLRTALAAPVRFGYRDAHWTLAPAYLAKLLVLPANGRTELAVGGPEAERFLADLRRGVARDPRDADFAVRAGGSVRVVSARSGRALEAEATKAALLAAMLSTTERQAELATRTIAPRLTTERARSFGVSRVLAAYGTPYSGTADRITNLRLAVAALDGTLVAPGATFSFNEVVGPRTEERGYRPAPVIMDGEYEEGVGGGVSQVATTVFNAAWEAGLRITARTAHALYIDRYPLGRDATVNYPDIDLRFTNDTDDWLVVRAESGETGISIALLGGKTNRRVVSVPGELREVAAPKVKRVPDSTLFVGERIVEDAGQPARSITVTRTVYENGEVLYRETWTTNYRSETKVVRVGATAKPVVEPKPKPKPKPPAGTTTTPTGTTTGGG